MGLDRTPNSFVKGTVALSPIEESMISQREDLLAPTYRLLYQRPLHIVRGEGIWLFDDAGDRYFDFYNNVASLGHCHPKVVEATQNQLSTLATNTRYLHDGIIKASTQLLATFPSALDKVIYACTGSEANDLAMRLAMKNTGATGVIVTDYAYHGTTSLLAGMSPTLGPMAPIAPHVRLVPAPRGNQQDLPQRFAQDVREAIDDLEKNGFGVAAFLFDSLFTSDGVYPDPAGFLKPAVERVQDHGGLIISDEVQPGFGRTGSHFWGFERHGILPDFVTLGKPMGNGYPVAAVITQANWLEEFGKDLRYFNTFGGNTVATAVVKAVLDVLQEEGLQDNAAAVGAYFLEALRQVSQDHPFVINARGAGLYLAVDIVDPDTGTPSKTKTSVIVNALRNRGFLISICGPDENVLKIRPPLILQAQHVDLFIAALRETLVTDLQTV
ncbi:MAG: aspartate aminotransferase family protein [Pseudomonadota bacterium]